jgi:hypothetical protein
MNTRRRQTAAVLATAISSLLTADPAAGQAFSDWEPATAVAGINTPVNDGCPIESRDGLSLYIASNREGTTGGNDIWVADRIAKDAPWSAPQNLGAPVNTTANDFCPTPVGGNWLFFVSERPGPQTCAAGPGGGDIYLVRHNPALGWGEPLHLGCAETGDGPNTVGAEFSPSLVHTAGGTYLYYSSNALGTQDIYASRLGENGRFGPGVRIAELSTEFDDRMPNVSKDGREIVFSSNRTDLGGYGGQDVYIAKRASPNLPWSAPVNAGSAVNTAGNETRASLSWDGLRLHFGRDGDVQVSTRTKISAGN